MTGKAAKPTTSAGIAMEYMRKKYGTSYGKQEGGENAQTGDGEIIDISGLSISESKNLAK
jgi:hypothetical protein